MVAPWSKITAYLNNWSYKVPAKSLGEDESGQKDSADILGDILKTGAKQYSVGKKGDSYVFRFSMVGEPDEVLGQAEQIVGAFEDIAKPEVSAGTAYAVVLFDDGTSETVHDKVSGKINIDEAGVKLMETVYDHLNEEVGIDADAAELAKEQQQQTQETEGLEMGQEGLSV
jgi:hypothetical protein